VDGHRLARVLEASYEEVEKMAKIDEFIDAYSDDLLYLLEAPVLLSHIHLGATTPLKNF
jgi:hypothetical protein